MPSACIHMYSNGTLCDKHARKSGYCKDHDPQEHKRAELVLAEDRKKQLLKERDRQQRLEQRQEIFEQELKNMIAECQSLEDLRKLELKVLQALIDGTIDDPRVGSPVAQLLKHQEQLLAKTKGAENDLKDDERTRAIDRAKNMTPEDMLGLIGDLAHGIKNLVKQAREEGAQESITEADEVTEVDDT